jgi:hypothetical protein
MPFFQQREKMEALVFILVVVVILVVMAFV